MVLKPKILCYRYKRDFVISIDLCFVNCSICWEMWQNKLTKNNKSCRIFPIFVFESKNVFEKIQEQNKRTDIIKDCEADNERYDQSKKSSTFILKTVYSTVYALLTCLYSNSNSTTMFVQSLIMRNQGPSGNPPFR